MTSYLLTLDTNISLMTQRRRLRNHNGAKGPRMCGWMHRLSNSSRRIKLQLAHLGTKEIVFCAGPRCTPWTRENYNAGCQRGHFVWYPSQRKRSSRYSAARGVHKQQRHFGVWYRLSMSVWVCLCVVCLSLVGRNRTRYCSHLDNQSCQECDHANSNFNVLAKRMQLLP